MFKRQTADAVEEAEREAAVHEVLEHLAEEIEYITRKYIDLYSNR